MGYVQARTELEAINTILSMVSRPPVNSLTELDQKGKDAQRILHEQSRAFQSQGWWFNTLSNYVLKRDVNNEIKLPVNTMDVEKSKEDYTYLTYTIKDNKLYNTLDNTYEFNADVTIDIIVAYEFSSRDIPQVAKEYITMQAGNVYASRVMQSETQFQFSGLELERALARLRSTDLQSKQAVFGYNQKALQASRRRVF